MLEIPVYNTSGKKLKTLEVDESIFGGTVNVALLKQAVVAGHANIRQGSARTKSRGMVKGSTRKMFKQKGTGNARRGDRKANILRGGGMAFRKENADYSKDFPRKMRKAALNSAILAKMLGDDLVILDGLKMDAPATKQMVGIIENLKINRSCLLAIGTDDKNIYLSSRNIKSLTVRPASQLNACDIANRMKMVITSEAMEAMISGRSEK